MASHNSQCCPSEGAVQGHHLDGDLARLSTEEGAEVDGDDVSSAVRGLGVVSVVGHRHCFQAVLFLGCEDELHLMHDHGEKAPLSIWKNGLVTFALSCMHTFVKYISFFLPLELVWNCSTC